MTGFLHGLGASSLAKRLFSSLFVPDPAVRFWRQQREYVLGRVREIRPDVILTSSPPHSLHDIGLWLSRETGIP
jgi:hypothetical protein